MSPSHMTESSYMWRDSCYLMLHALQRSPCTPHSYAWHTLIHRCKITHIRESRHKQLSQGTHITDIASHSSLICDITHLYVWHYTHTWFTSQTPESWHTHCRYHLALLAHMCDALMCRTSMCKTWLTRMRDLTHSYVWHGWSVCVRFLIHMCDMTRIWMCHTTHSYVSVTPHVQGGEDS